MTEALPRGARALWLTGLSAAGKTTLGEAMIASARREGIETILLDGDALRSGLCSDLGFSPEDRSENVRRTAEVAKVLVAQGRSVICALISPLAVHRQTARGILGDAFVEVYVRCDLDECVRRDPRGLYQRALSGSIPAFTGVSAPYEPPEAPDLVLDTQAMSLEACVAELMQHLRKPLCRASD